MITQGYKPLKLHLFRRNGRWEQTQETGPEQAFLMAQPLDVQQAFAGNALRAAWWRMARNGAQQSTHTHGAHNR